MVRRTPSTTYYYVCKIADHEGTVTFEALASSDLKCRLGELKKDYIEAYKGWREDKKETEKAGDKFTDPKPKKPLYKSVKIKGKAKADALVAKYQAKWDARQAKRESEADTGDALTDDEPKKKAPAKDAKKYKKG